MRNSDWSSDVCSSDLATYRGLPNVLVIMFALIMFYRFVTNRTVIGRRIYALGGNIKAAKLSGIKTERLTFYTFVNMRSEEHTSELQSLMRISYAVFCLKNKKYNIILPLLL